MPTLFRRKSTAAVIEETDTQEAVVTERHSRAYTQSKRERGLTTPKRAGANPRRPGPSTGTGRGGRGGGGGDARATAKEKRLEERSAMMRGEEWALLPRDRGPEKKLARDLVDSRRNVGSLVLGALIVIVLLSLGSPGLAALADLFFLFLLLLIAIDSVFLCRRLRKLVHERLPNTEPPWGKLYRYAILRSTSFRFLRVPRPQFKPGTKI